MTPRGERCRSVERLDRGSVMPMTTILVVFVMVGGWALMSASQQWNARRDAHTVAAAAARAAAQGDERSLRASGVIDPGAAAARADAIITASGYWGSVAVDGDTVTVTVTAPVDYAFPSPGFPAAVSGTATAVAARGVTTASP